MASPASFAGSRDGGRLASFRSRLQTAFQDVSPEWSAGRVLPPAKPRISLRFGLAAFFEECGPQARHEVATDIKTSIEAFRGIWLKVSPQGRTGTDRYPGVFRWNLGANLLPRTHFNVTVDFYREKTAGIVDPLKTFLSQLHLYL